MRFFEASDVGLPKFSTSIQLTTQVIRELEIK